MIELTVFQQVLYHRISLAETEMLDYLDEGISTR